MPVLVRNMGWVSQLLKKCLQYDMFGQENTADYDSANQSQIPFIGSEVRYAIISDSLKADFCR